jgi:hypothetical protein
MLRYFTKSGERMKLTANDFERLTETQMEWNSLIDWKEQADRFEDTINWNHKFIFWTENYASALLATEYLTQQGFSYSISYDEAVSQYCFTTDYSGSWYGAGVKQ